MATISTFLKKSKTNTKGEHPIVMRLADSENKRAYFSTGFYCSERQFDEESGRVIQGTGIKKFFLERKEEGGSIKRYSNVEANDKLAELEGRARKILKQYNEDHVSWSISQFRDDFINKPNRELFHSYANNIIENEYRKQGIASALTSALAKEILIREKVPFYCSAWSNIRSVRNAVKSGFVPAWVELSAKPADFVDEINRNL